MKIYTLTITETQKSFSPMEVHTFVSHEQAHKAMIQKFHDKLKEFNMDIPTEELDNPNGYEDGGIAIGYDYAKDEESMVLLEIFESELFMRETIIGSIMDYIRENYKTPARFDDVLYRLINEYKDEDLNAIESKSAFVENYIIGEALYENALAELGGKTDEKSYEAILKYLDESSQFLDVRCGMFCFGDLPIEEENLEDWQRWFIGMLCICDGNQTMINLVREDIDDRQPLGDKIFVIERKREIVSNAQLQLCPNHRQLCSELSDDQYYEVMAYILNYKFDFGYGKDFRKQMTHIYDEMKYVVYTIIKKKGIDVLFNTYGHIIEVNDSPEVGWYVVFIGDPYEVADMVDDLKATYKELF